MSSKINNTTSEIKKVFAKVGNSKEKDPYEELKKLKDLLDNKIITEEEFEQKKKQLLDL